jgi:dihydrofolate reductase
MRKIIVSEHVTLDGFVAGANGEMDWIKLDDAMFELVNEFTNEADIALYGRITYEMMEAYWPTAADQPNATKHDVDHSNWYNKSEKIILSRTMNEVKKERTKFINEDAVAALEEIKNDGDKDILVFGSPSVVHLLMQHNLVDEYWLFVNPVILGEGIQMFTRLPTKTSLELVASKVFACGVTGLNYKVTG